MAVRIMSDKKFARLEVLRDLDGQRLTAQARGGSHRGAGDHP